MPRILCLSLAGIVLGLLIGVPLAYGTWSYYQHRNLHVVEEGVLYRSAQLPLDGLKQAVFDHGIKTVVTLRFAPTPGSPAPDAGEEEYCRQHGLRYYRLPMGSWEKNADSAPPPEAQVKRFVEIMADKRNHPVLVHCFAGIHRTGTLCAVYRMEFDHWSCEDAMREMRAMGYTAHHEDVFGFLRSYRSRDHGHAKE